MYKKLKVEATYDRSIERNCYHETPFLFRKSFSFENRSEVPITIIDRNNIPVVFEVNPSIYTRGKGFIIRVTYEIMGGHTVRDILYRLGEFEKAFDVQDENHKLIYMTLKTLWEANPNMNLYRFTIERQIQIADLRSYGCIYEEDTDYMLCLSTSWLKTPHPNSHEGRMLANHAELVKSKNVSGCIIEVVDNDNMISDRFIYCAKNLIRLKSTIDTTRLSGVYFSKFENSPHDADRLEQSFLTFDEAEEALGLFKTAEEALTGGAPDLLAKKEANEAQKQVEVLKREAELAKAEAKRREAEIESELRTIRGDYQKLKEQYEIESLERDERERKRKEEYAVREEVRKDRSSQRSDYYEERSYRRKDSSEFFKWAPAVVVGALSIAAVFLRR